MIITPFRTKIRVCRWCNHFFIPETPNQQYCTKLHSKYSRSEQNRTHRRAHYHKYKEVRFEYPIGNSGLGPVPCDDLEKEKQLIAKEKRRIGL